MIIGFVGFISSGKNLAAALLVQQGFTTVSFASSLKDAVSVIFHWDRDLLEGVSDESREWRETIDPWWSKKLDIPQLSPRWVMQNLGTNALRHHFHTDIWVASLERKLMSMSGNIVVADCRFPNEINMIRSLSGQVYRIKRGHDPHWFDYAAYYNLGDKNNMRWATSKEQLKKNSVHESEIAWIGAQFDGTVENNGTVDEFRDKIIGLVK